MKTTLLYCERCDWERDSGGGIICANVCPKCEKHGLYYIRFTPEEEPEAREDMAWKRTAYFRSCEYRRMAPKWRAMGFPI